MDILRMGDDVSDIVSRTNTVKILPLLLLH